MSLSVLRDVEQEVDRFRGRVLAAGVFVLLAFLLLATRLIYLQVFRHEELATQAEANRIAVVPIVPNRGIIVDRNGVVLATNYSAYTLEISPAAAASAARTVPASSRHWWTNSRPLSRSPRATAVALSD